MHHSVTVNACLSSHTLRLRLPGLSNSVKMLFVVASIRLLVITDIKDCPFEKASWGD